MQKYFIRINNILLLVIMGVAMIMAGVFYFGSVVEGTEGTSMVEPVITEPMIRFAYVLLGIAAVVTIVFSLFNVFSSWKSMQRSLIVLAIVAVLFVVARSLASDALLIVNYDLQGNNPVTLKWTDTGIYLMYILLGLAICSIFYVEIAKYFKK